MKLAPLNPDTAEPGDRCFLKGSEASAEDYRKTGPT